MSDRPPEPRCTLCSGVPRRPFARQQRATWWKCPECGLFFVHPQPDEATLAALYRTTYYEQRLDTSPASMASDVDYWDARAAHLAEAADVTRVLDVGCGTGQFIAAGLRRGWSVWGTELAMEAVEALPPTLRSRTVVATMDQAPFRDASFDAITLFDVIEHVRAPIDFLKAVRRSLTGGGTVMVTTPNAAVLKARIRGRFWKYFRFERYLHLYHFTPDTLTGCFQASGFEVTRWFNRGMPMSVAAQAVA